MHFHDLRAKALTDPKRQQGAAAAQSLAGHTTESMTAPLHEIARSGTRPASPH
ncbi:site-specific recombinase, phage integrase family [Burkholderia pseudomallei 1710a]|nr:site-specific recombinase, phage integrase family [Burkholderia pseudomallei 1710a]